MKTTQKIVNNLINKNIFPLKVSSLIQDWWYLEITNLCKKIRFTYKVFNWFYYTCSYIKWYNFQYGRFPFLVVCLHVGLFWSAGIPTMSMRQTRQVPYDVKVLPNTFLAPYHMHAPAWTYNSGSTLHDSHHTGIFEIVQQLKVFQHHSETYLLTVFFINTLFSHIFIYLQFSMFSSTLLIACRISDVPVRWLSLSIHVM